MAYIVRDRIKLSDRLMMSVSRVTPGHSVADVGCDHAHSAIWLVKHRICPRAIAMDVRQGPLERAEGNINLFGCSDKIETRLSYGLDELRPGEADTILICGMGGKLTRDILVRGCDRVYTAAELILQPQSDIHEVRDFLYSHGFDIADEAMCREDDKLYTVIKAVNQRAFMMNDNNRTDKQNTVTEVYEDNTELYTEPVYKGTNYERDIRYGQLLLERREPLLKDYLDIGQGKLIRAKQELEENGTEHAKKKLNTINRELEIIQDAIDIFN